MRKIINAILDSEASNWTHESKDNKTIKTGLNDDREKVLQKLENDLACLFLPERWFEYTSFVRRDADKGITFEALRLIWNQI